MLVTAGPAHGAPAPKVRELVVFKSGKAVEKQVRAKRARVRVEGRRCAVPARSPLAALVRIKPGPTVLEDFGSCSRRPKDAGSLYVKRIRTEGERGAGGWVYKVGRVTPGIGAGDPTWRLRAGKRVLWFWCRQSGNCQRSLEVRTSVGSGGVVTARVTGYDDNGRGAGIEGATVTIGPVEVQTDASGVAQATVPAGTHRVRAEKTGLVRSFTERVMVG